MLRSKGFEWQYEGRFQLVHLDETATMVGRALTATFVPKRPDLDKALTEKGHADGHVGGRNSWPIDMLQKGDVYVANAFSSYEGGPIIGGNLATAIYRNSGNGVVFDGSVRDIAQMETIAGFKAWVRDWHPSYNYDNMLVEINRPARIGTMTCLPGDVVLAKREGVICIPPVLAELVCKTGEVVQLRDMFGFQRIKEGVYTPGQIDQRWRDDMEKDFSKWLNDHIDKLPVAARADPGAAEGADLVGRRPWTNRHGRAARSCARRRRGRGRPRGPARRPRRGGGADAALLEPLRAADHRRAGRPHPRPAQPLREGRDEPGHLRLRRGGGRRLRLVLRDEAHRRAAPRRQEPARRPPAPGGDAPRRALQGRAGRHVRLRDVGARDGALGPRRQGPRAARLPAPRRQVPGQDPGLLRHRGQPPRARGDGPAGEGGRREVRLHRGQVRHRRRGRPEEARPLQLEREPPPSSSGWWRRSPAVRAAVGPHVDICVDCHGRFDEQSGHKIAKAMEPFDLMWLEEPVPAEFPEAYARIRQETTTPICGGENWYLTYGFRRPLEIGAVRRGHARPAEVRAGSARGSGSRTSPTPTTCPFAPHMVASYLGAMASAHVCASVPNFLILEWQIYFHTDKMFQEIVTFDGPMLTADGHIPLRDAPGIGVEIDEDALRKYAVKDVPFFE